MGLTKFLICISHIRGPFTEQLLKFKVVKQNSNTC